MPNLLARGQAFLSRQMTLSAGVPVTYVRPGQFDVALTARPGDESATAQPVGATQKPRLQAAERDYILAAADLKTQAGEAFLPRAGDRVLETINGVACEFELTPRGQEPCWRYSDPQRTDVRLHTQRVT